MGQILKFELFFARRITFQGQRRISILVIRLAVISIALAVATMEIAVSVVQGYETAIQEKVIGFGSHLQIGNYLRTSDTELVPLPRDEPGIAAIDSLPYVNKVVPYVTYVGFFVDQGIEDIWLKGVDSLYDWRFFETVMKAGQIPAFDGPRESLELLISQRLSRQLSLEVGQKVRLYFWDQGESVRFRPVTIAGIYETGMEEFDSRQVFCDIRMLQKLLDWDKNEVSGFEVYLTSLESTGRAYEEINEMIPFNYQAVPITSLYPDIFDWLNLLDQNVWLILVLMCLVAIINMSSVVLILILERTQTIGILQALGLTRRRTRRLFVANALFLILLGVLIGNLLGLGLLYSQDSWGWLTLDQESYFLQTAPVAWEWKAFFLVNLGVILICTLFMYVPTRIISGNQSIIKTLRFD